MSEHTFVARPGARLLSSMAVKSAAPLAPADGHFLAGFLEAEASFGLGSNNGGQGWQAWLSLNLRDDDAGLLVDLARITALGVLTPVPARRTRTRKLSGRSPVVQSASGSRSSSADIRCADENEQRPKCGVEQSARCEEGHARRSFPSPTRNFMRCGVM